MSEYLEAVAKWSKKNRPLKRVLKKTERETPTEYEEQCTVVSWFRTQYPKFRRRLQASGNGAFLAGDKKQRIIQAAKLKRAGQVAGQSDLFLSIPRKGFGGLYIEMKALDGRATKEQLEFLDDMTDAGYMAVMCKGANAAIDTIRSYMS